MLYGGSVYGGKSEAITVLPLRFVEHPKHRAIILRRTRPQLQETIDRTLQLYSTIVPGAQWREAESRWRFPSGAIIQMGYAEHEKDIFQFKTFEYNLVCFDELTTFSESMYSFMMLRNRTKSPDLPIWVRSGTNPGDIGHEWVYTRFIKDRQPYRLYTEAIKYDGRPLKITRQFIPSSVYDNEAMSPSDRDEYIAGIVSSMPPEDVSAYLGGDWTKLAGAMFKSPLVQTLEPTLLNSDYIVIRAIDYGWDDPTCVLWCAYYPTANVLDVVAELYVRETTLDGICHYILERELDLKLRPVVYSVGSPEMGNTKAELDGQSISSMMTMKGVHVERANTDRLAGWANIQNMTAKAAIRVWPGAAPNLIRTLPTLQRNSGPGKNPNELRKNQEDHAADALRYAVMAVYETPAATQPPPSRIIDPSKQDVVFDKVMAELRKQRSGAFVPELGHWS